MILMIDISHKTARSFQREELLQGKMPHNGTGIAFSTGSP